MASTGLKGFPAEETLECPKCSAIITLYDPEGSEFCTCSNCNRYYKFENNIPTQTKKRLNELKREPIVALGSIGFFFGTEYKLIAYFEKAESGTGAEWREYLLYNYSSGYAILAEYNGHWTITLSEVINLNVSNNEEYLHYEGKKFEAYNQYGVVLKAMMGECDWDIGDERIQVNEFVCPPFIIFQEYERKNKGINQCYLGEYLQPNDVAKAFSIPKSTLPIKIGVGSNEPNFYKQQSRPLILMSGIAAIIMLITLYFNSKNRPYKEIFQQSFNVTYNYLNTVPGFEPIVSNSFNLDSKYSNLEFKFDAPIMNNWFESTFILVDEKTNKTWEITKGFEYYEGVEDGEQWSEGSRSARIMLSKIPAGKYHINIFPSTSDFSPSTLHVHVTANKILWRNIIITILLISIYPGIIWFLARRMENDRWA